MTISTLLGFACAVSCLLPSFMDLLIAQSPGPSLPVRRALNHPITLFLCLCFAYVSL